MTLLEQCQALRTAMRDAVPPGVVLDQALVACDTLDATARYVTITGEKAIADSLAGKDIDTLMPVEREAYVNLVRAKAVAVVEKAAADAAEADKVADA